MSTAAIPTVPTVAVLRIPFRPLGAHPGPRYAVRYSLMFRRWVVRDTRDGNRIVASSRTRSDCVAFAETFGR